MPELKPLPCPACGSENTHFGIVENYAPPGRDEHFIECWCCDMQGPHRDTESAAIAAWNSLPRALTWTHEPPKVAGWYWWRDVSHKGEATIQYMSQSQVERLKTYPGEEWAGPIPAPLEPEES